MRAKVEHAIGVIKCVFGFVKVRYRGGLAKNAHRLFVACALANLYIARAAHEQAGGVSRKTPPHNATTTPKRGQQIEPAYALRRQSPEVTSKNLLIQTFS